MNSTDLAAKVASLQSDLARIEADREQHALDAERGVAVSARTMSDLNVERGRLSAAIEQARMAHGVALRQEEAEVRAEALRRVEEQRQRELAIGQKCNVIVARIQGHLDGLVQDLQELAKEHESYGVLPAYLRSLVSAMPDLVTNALGQSGVFGLSRYRAMFLDQKTNDIPICRPLTEVYPAPEAFVQTSL